MLGSHRLCTKCNSEMMGFGAGSTLGAGIVLGLLGFLGVWILGFLGVWILGVLGPVIILPLVLLLGIILLSGRRVEDGSFKVSCKISFKVSCKISFKVSFKVEGGSFKVMMFTRLEGEDRRRVK